MNSRCIEEILNCFPEANLLFFSVIGKRNLMPKPQGEEILDEYIFSLIRKGLDVFMYEIHSILFQLPPEYIGIECMGYIEKRGEKGKIYSLA